MKYFYIICRDNSIHEVQYTKERYTKAMEKWADGGILFIPSRNSEAPIGINCVDVKNIFSAEDYENWVESASPRQYVSNGVWYNGRDGSVVRYEKWTKQFQLQNEKQESLRLESNDKKDEEQVTNVSPERIAELRNSLKEIFTSYKWKDYE